MLDVETIFQGLYLAVLIISIVAAVFYGLGRRRLARELMGARDILLRIINVAEVEHRVPDELLSEAKKRVNTHNPKNCK